ncbi:MAG: hypothetical protein ACRCUY_02545 [Thermoguttaceae bacterium]
MRSIVSFISVCILVLVSASFLVEAQESSPDAAPLPATPEILTTISNMKVTVAASTEIDEKLQGFFGVLALEMRLDDKTAAKKTMQEILALMPQLTNESAKSDVLGAIAFVQSEIGDMEGMGKTLLLIDKAASKSEAIINLVEKVVEENEASKKSTTFDAAPLLEQAVLSAAEAKDNGLETLALAMLGREQMKLGKKEEAKANFEKARAKARGLEEIEERNMVAVIVRSLVQFGEVTDAAAMIATINDEELRPALLGLAIITLAKEGKLAEAQKLLGTMEKGELRDNTIIGLAKELAATAELEVLLQNVELLAETDRAEILKDIAFQALIEAKRFDIAEKLAEKMSDAEKSKRILTIQKIRILLDDNKFDDAEKLAQTISDPELNKGISRAILVSRIKNGELISPEKMTAQLSDAEKEETKQLREKVAKIAESDDFETIQSAMEDILQQQLALFDLEGVIQSLDILVKKSEKQPNLRQFLNTRLGLAQLQTQFNKEVAKSNILGILVRLDAAKSLEELKGLLPEEAPATDILPGLPGSENVLTPAMTTSPAADKTPVDPAVQERAIKTELFQIYAGLSDVLSELGAKDEAKATLQKAIDIAEKESNQSTKGKMLQVIVVLLEKLAK